MGVGPHDKLKNEIFHRNLRLPDERPRLGADGRAARAGRLRAGARRRRCRRRRDQHLQRARARRRQALHAPWRDPAVERRNGPFARCGGRRLRGAAGSRGAAEAVFDGRRRDRHAEPEATARAHRPGRPRRPAPDRRQPLRRCVVSAGGGAAPRPGEGLRHDHRRLQRVLLVLCGALHARPRAHAAQARHPGRSGASRRARAPRNPAPRPDREPLPGPGRPHVRFRGAAGGRPRGARRRADPVREPAPEARAGPAAGSHAGPSEGLQTPSPSGAIRIHEGAGRHAPAVYARQLISSWSTRCAPRFQA